MTTDLLTNLEKIHTTPLGAQRIRRNLNLNDIDLNLWFIQLLNTSNDIIRKGKNWYVNANGITLTINAHSFTVITAHKIK